MPEALPSQLSMLEDDADSAAQQSEHSVNLRRSIIGSASMYRENELTTKVEISCSTTIQQDNGTSTALSLHPLARKHRDDPAQWSKRSDISCWHCCHAFDTQPVYIPDSCTPSGIYTVWGIFCSFACAKAHLLDINAFSCSLQLLLLNRMAREVYHVKKELHAAPPRFCLTMFGGRLDIESFRKMNAVKMVTLTSTPFVPKMLVEEVTPLSVDDAAPNARGGLQDDPDAYPAAQTEGREDDEPSNNIVTWAVRGLRRPAQPLQLPRAGSRHSDASLLDQFVSAKQSGAPWSAPTGAQKSTVAAPTPSIDEVQRAASSGSRRGGGAAASRRGKRTASNAMVSSTGLGRFVAASSASDDD